MDLFHALILGIVQGLTEFLPVSSSGHLIIIPKIFHWGGIVDTLSFDVSLHLGTATALIIFFWKDWIRLTLHFFDKRFKDRKNILKDPDSKLFLLLIVGSVPAGLIGFLFQNFIEENVRSTLLIGVTLIVFGFLLWYFDKIAKNKENLKQINFKDAVIIGVAQAIALIPGVSRSGVTITAARAMNIDRESAVRFSFLLSAPAVLGAGLLTSRKLLKEGFGSPFIFLVGFLAAVVSGIFAIKLLLYLAKKDNFNIFVIYRLLLGAFLIVYSLFFS